MQAPNQTATNATNEARARDLQLVHRLLTGCDAAWRELICKYATLVRTRIQRVAIACGGASDSTSIDDCVAEAFSALLTNDHAALRAFAGRSSLGTYLCVIAARVTMRSALVQRHSTTTANIESQSEIHDTHASDPSQIAITEEQRLRLREKIDGLPSKQRDLVDLFYLQGNSYREISQKLSIPIGSIGPSLKRAEEKLRNLLGPMT